MKADDKTVYVEGYRGSKLQSDCFFVGEVFQYKVGKILLAAGRR